MAPLPTALALICLTAGVAVANPVFSTLPTQSSGLGLLVAQASATVLTDSDLRRLNHYSTRCLEDLLLLGDSPSELELSKFRTSIIRLIDAAKRSGLSEEQVADYFFAFATQNSNDLPALFLTSTGKDETRLLFENVSVFFEANNKEVDVSAVEDADLAGMQSIANVTPIVTAQPAIAVPVVARPEIPATANPIVRAIFERIELRGDDWVIEVVIGDSLSQFADALYGNRSKFRLIYEANRDILNSANILEVGQLIVLPKQP